MKKVSLVVLILIGSLFNLLAFPVAAQEQEIPPCAPDLTAIRELFDQVDGFSSAGDDENAFATLKSAHDQLKALVDACTPRIVLKLAERLVLRDGQLTLNYPDNWLRDIAADSSDPGNTTYVQFANKISVFNNTSSSVPVMNPGDQLIILIFGAPEAIISGSQLNPSAESILVSFQQTILEGSDTQGFRFGEMELLSINDRRAAGVSFSGITFEAQVYVVELQTASSFAVLLALSAPGELDILAPAVLEMAESMRYDPNAAPLPTATPVFVPSLVPSPTATP